MRRAQLRPNPQAFRPCARPAAQVCGARENRLHSRTFQPSAPIAAGQATYVYPHQGAGGTGRLDRLFQLAGRRMETDSRIVPLGDRGAQPSPRHRARSNPRSLLIPYGPGQPIPGYILKTTAIPGETRDRGTCPPRVAAGTTRGWELSFSTSIRAGILMTNVRILTSTQQLQNDLAFCRRLLNKAVSAAIQKPISLPRSIDYEQQFITAYTRNL